MSGFLLQISTYVALNWVLALGLYLASASGQLSLGHAAFMAIGAYGAAVLTTEFQLPLSVAIAAAALLSLLAGVLVASSSLRLRGIFLGLTTYAICEVVVGVLENIDYVGGPRGYIGIPMLTSPGLAWGMGVVLTAVVVVLMRSPAALALRALKGDDVAAVAVGIPVDRLKLVMFGLSAAVTGIGGALYAHYLGILEPQNLGTPQSIRILAFLVVGGEHSVLGPFVGALVLTLMQELLGAYSLMLYGLVLIIAVIVRPDGLVGRRLQPMPYRSKTGRQGEDAPVGVARR
jgi:branched-chain amino acid transport system permease protein